MSSSTLTPYLSFRGEAREALTFYGAVFGTEANMSTHGQFGMEGPEADWVMHGELETPAGHLMAADVPSSMDAPMGGAGAINLCLWGDDEAAIAGWFEALADGGTITTPLAKQMWGDSYGDLVDKFGIRWAANISGTQA